MAVKQGHHSVQVLMHRHRTGQERVAFTQHGIEHRISGTLLKASSIPLKLVHQIINMKLRNNPLFQSQNIGTPTTHLDWSVVPSEPR